MATSHAALVHWSASDLYYLWVHFDILCILLSSLVIDSFLGFTAFLLRLLSVKFLILVSLEWTNKLFGELIFVIIIWHVSNLLDTSPRCVMIIQHLRGFSCLLPFQPSIMQLLILHKQQHTLQVALSVLLVCFIEIWVTS